MDCAKLLKGSLLWHWDPVYTIRPDSGCTLAVMTIMAVTKTLPDRIWHVYWLATSDDIRRGTVGHFSFSLSVACTCTGI